MRQSAIGKMLLAWAPRRSCRPAWALQRRAIGKMLLTSAAAELLTGWGAVAKLLAGGAAVAKRKAGNAKADWHENARNAKEPAPTDGTGPSQTFGYIQAEQSLVEDFACLFLLGMRIYI